MFFNIDTNTLGLLKDAGMPSSGACFGSKSAYYHAHKNDNFGFNLRMVVSGRIIWWGDLNITENQAAIDAVANKIGDVVYICRESDAWDEERISLDNPVYIAHPSMPMAQEMNDSSSR